MAPGRPLIGIPADRRMVGLHPFHVVGEKYARAVLDAAGGVPLFIPSLAQELGLDELLERLDGLLFTGSPRTSSRTTTRVRRAMPGTLHDPASRCDDAAADSAARSQRGVPVLRHLPRLSGDERRLRRHAAPEAARGRRASAITARTRTQPLEVQYGPAHEVTLEPGGAAALARAAPSASRSIRCTRRACDRLGPRARRRGARPRRRRSKPSACSDARRFALAVQWHPEWQVMSNPFSRALFAAFGAARRERAQSK